MNAIQALLQTDHYQPHHFSRFEGYYSKFDLPSGARLLLVLCTIPYAPGKKHYVTVVYVPKDGFNIWQREFFPDDMKITTSRDGFTVAASDILGQMTANAHSVHYDVDASGIEFSATTSQRTPWSSSWFDTPAGPLAWLPLPLHWHVHSLASQCSFSLSLPREAKLASADKQGHAVVHEEKNWANSFPPAHNWIQGRKVDSNICLAGGRTMGVEAFLVGYRNKDLDIELDFRPPFAMKVFGCAPFMIHRLDWLNRTFFLSVQDLRYKLEILATGKKGTCFGLSSPMPGGFADNFLGQNLNSKVEVKLYRSTGVLFGKWEHTYTDIFENAALEFGGLYYPPRGTDQTIN